MTGRFGSVVTAMVTPFRQDHALDLDRAQELASWLVENGSDAVVVAGSTGESPTITHKEKSELFLAVGEAIRGRGKLICGTGTYSTAETLELTQAAEDANADGLLVVTPYYNKPPQRGLIAHFERIAEATELPIIAYNIPGRTATRIEHDTLLRLAERPNIVAVKDSTGDFQGISRLIAEVPEGFEVYSGDDWATFGYVCLGAVGVVSVGSHLVGMQIHREQPVHPGAHQHVGHHLCRDRHARTARPAVLAGVPEVRDRRGDARRAGAAQCVRHDHHFHQRVVGRRAGGLEDEAVLAADVLQQLDHHFAVAELRDGRLPELDVQPLRDLLRELRVRSSGEHHQVVEGHGSLVTGNVRKIGRGGRIRTFECWNQNPVP